MKEIAVSRRKFWSMKPVPFVRHAPRTVAEAIAMLAEFGRKDGRVLAGGQSLVPIMAFRMARPAHLVDINGIAELARRRAPAIRLSIGAVVRHAAFHRPAVDGPMGRAARHCRAPHRALSDPHARHILRQSRACRSCVGMVPGRGDARRRRWSRSSARGQRVIAADDFFEGHHDDGAGGRRDPRRGSPAGHFRPDPLRLL